ncbi:MAG: cytochrome C oxidase subunit I [Gallionellales bacterium RIFCSPLOWO2_02_FULL_57_47]|nr:MAG: cytochrome C oxidase subunit I [Gallionellales bacterium RIFCSPLOWO2_02_FULL_57_47]OGT12188.1 MAG: cytochrome C oxidase subunit I [Gallionellales bacterium RIFCSPHIGHO2_02_FULL_57_16]
MLIQLAIMGMLAALLPLAIVWVSNDTDKYRKLVWVTLFLTFDLIMFGAFTRLTDSGLGCPDWPGCYGQANPLQAHADISAAETAMPTGPVTVMKAWIEMIHRYFAMGIGVLIVAMMVIAWRKWLQSSRKEKKFSPVFPTLLFAFVCLQGAFGAWTVTMKLQPIIVTIHLLLGIALLALLAWFGSRQSDHPPVSQLAAVLRIPAALAAVLLMIQIALGGWVSSNYAALACTDFPLCHGALLPQMDFANGFTLWRDLGMTAKGEYLPFPALTAIHWMHRVYAFVVVLLVARVALAALKIEGLLKTARWLLIMIVLQFTTGVLTVYLDFPLALAVIHNGGAALLVLLLVSFNYRIRSAPETASN